MNLAAQIRNIKDFPQEGVIFRDITTLLKNPEAMKEAVDRIVEGLKDIEFDYILGPESRGFIFGMPVAYIMNKGFIPVRKKGKLPAETVSKEYSLEYGTAVIEIHKDALKPGDKVVVVDDLIATGGTAKALAELVEEVGAEVCAMTFLIELEDLKGRDVLKDYNVKSIVKY